MGAELSCDVCQQTLSEDEDKVREYRGGDPGRVCLSCYVPDVHVGYIERTVYAVVGEENARRMNEGLTNRDPTVEEDVRIVTTGFSDVLSCPCGAQTVRRVGVSECFACGRAFGES